MGALVGLRRGRRVQARLSNLLVVLLVIFVLPSALNLTNESAELSWYGARYRVLPFSVCATLVFAAWAILGATRAMCMELQLRTRPGWWLGFALFAAAFGTGFTAIDPQQPLALARGLLSTVTIAAVVQSYMAGFAYPCDPIQFRRVLRALATRSYGRALEELPLWLASAAAALIVALAATLIGAAPELTNYRPENLGVAGLALA